MKKAYMRNIRGLILLVCLILLSSCGGSEVDSEQSGDTIEKAGLVTAAATEAQQQSILSNEQTESGMILAMFDGKAVDSVLQQPIFSIYRLDERGNLYHLYTPPTSTTSGEYYDVSPNGQWIIFLQEDAKTRQSDIYKIRTNGMEFARLTDTPVQESGLRWSPDGKTIAYATQEVGQNKSKIVLMDARGNELEILAIVEHTIQDLRWSPDGERLMFNSVNLEGSVRGIFVVEVEGKQVKEISLGLETARDGAWSPNGHYIALTARDKERDRVYIYDFATGKVEQISKDSNLWQVSASAWSPDGRYLVLSGTHFNSIDETDVWLWDTHLKTLQNLTDSIRYSMQFLSWSPDAAKMLLVASINGPEMRLFVLDMTKREIYPFEGIPYLSFGVRLLKWGNLAAMPEDAYPIATGIRFSAEPTQSSFTPVETERSTYKEVTVTALDTIKIRSGPSIQSLIIGEISEGESLTALGLSIGQDWLQVRYGESETGLAWVFAAITDYDRYITPLPTVDADPLPP